MLLGKTVTHSLQTAENAFYPIEGLSFCSKLLNYQLGFRRPKPMCHFIYLSSKSFSQAFHTRDAKQVNSSEHSQTHTTKVILTGIPHQRRKASKFVRAFSDSHDKGHSHRHSTPETQSKVCQSILRLTRQRSFSHAFHTRDAKQVNSSKHSQTRTTKVILTGIPH